MSVSDVEPIAYPFNEGGGLGLNERYAQARQDAGMLRVRMPYGEPAWLAVRYADARQVLGDQRFSRAAAAAHDEPRSAPMQRTTGILGMDPPEHTRLRSLVAKAFTVRRVEQLRPRVRQLAADLLDEMQAAGPPVDLVQRYALPIPVAVICELLGVPVADRAKFRVWSDAALTTSGLSQAELERHQFELQEYMSGLIEQHRAEPADDLMTALIEARDVQDRLSELELVELCIAILVAGHETTATQIPNFTYVLLENPDRFAALRADPSLVPQAIEELLRYVPLGAGSGFPRYATEDVQVGGVLVRAGEPVLVAIGAANRDTERFDAPENLDFHRSGNQHLGFGHGVHHCLGAQLARLELQEAIGALIERFPALRLAGEVEWKSAMLIRGPRAMPVAW